MPDSPTEKLRDLTPVAESELVQRRVTLQSFESKPRKLGAIALGADPIGSTVVIFFILALLLGPAVFLGPLGLLPTGIIFLIALTEIRSDVITISIEGKNFSVQSNKEEPIEFNTFDIDQIYVYRQNYMFAAGLNPYKRFRFYTYRRGRRGSRRFYIPFTAFKSEDDRLYFESLFPDWKIKRK